MSLRSDAIRTFRPERYDNGLDASTQKLICDNSPIERGVFDRGDGTRSQDGGFGFVEDEMGYAGVGGVGQENGGSRVEEDGDGEAGGEGEDLQNRFEGDFELEDEKGGEGGAKGGGGAEGGREEGLWFGVSGVWFVKGIGLEWWEVR